jgi:hypothetical protein
MLKKIAGGQAPSVVSSSTVGEKAPSVPSTASTASAASAASAASVAVDHISVGTYYPPGDKQDFKHNTCSIDCMDKDETDPFKSSAVISHR